MNKSVLKLFLGGLILLAPFIAKAHCEIQNKSESNKLECLKEARFLLPQTTASAEEIQHQLYNPEIENNKAKAFEFKNDETYHCRYNFQNQNGLSSKFRCALTDENNQLYDSKGNLAPEAAQLVSQGDDVYLADSNGQILEQESEKGLKKRKAYILKVRYHNGDARNLENYTSTAATKILNVLGIPAHTYIMTNQIICFGCSNDPFKNKQKDLSFDGSQFSKVSFKDAALEFKYDADRIFAPSEDAWNWRHVKDMINQNIWSNEIKIEAEVLALASHFLGYVSEGHDQNALICKAEDSSDSSVCESTLAMIHDVGASFGNRKEFSWDGSRPRGNIRAYERARIFDMGTCKFDYSTSKGDLPRSSISKAAKEEFLRRAQKLDQKTLEIIFATSHMGNIKNSGSNKNIIERWAKSILSKIDEVKYVSCEN